MDLTRGLSDFNSQMVTALDELKVFAPNIEAFQGEEGSLLMRGPIGEVRCGTHVSVSLDPSVSQLIESADPVRCQEIIQVLVGNLSAQVHALYTLMQSAESR